MFLFIINQILLSSLVYTIDIFFPQLTRGSWKMLSSAEQDMWSEKYKEPLKLLQHLRRKVMRNLES